MLGLILQRILQVRCSSFYFGGRETEARGLTVSTVEMAHKFHVVDNLLKLPGPVLLAQLRKGRPTPLTCSDCGPMQLTGGGDRSSFCFFNRDVNCGELWRKQRAHSLRVNASFLARLDGMNYG